MKKITIKILPLNKTFNHSHKLPLLEMLNAEGITTYAPCGGKGICGKCKVKVSGNLSALTDAEKAYLSNKEINRGVRLACKTYVKDEATVDLTTNTIINNFKEEAGRGKLYKINSRVSKIVIAIKGQPLKDHHSVMGFISTELTSKNINVNTDTFNQIPPNLIDSKKLTVTLYDNNLINIEKGNTEEFQYGVAVDIGTTTIACYLINLHNGEQVSTHSLQNPQTGYGADIMTRINYCLENKSGLKTLNTAVKHAVDSAIKFTSKKADIKPRNIYECVLVGNTAMNHFFLGLDTASLSMLPFNPVTNEMVKLNAQSIGVSSINPNAKVTFLPNIGGFVGSDLLSDMIATNLKNSKGNLILIDLGTNGEILLSTPKKKLVCSTAAGPALEGAKIKNGMQAFSGAINTVGFDGNDIYYTTIDNQKPKGICGSGLIDAVNILLETGIISKSGNIVVPEKVSNKKLASRIIVNDCKKEVILAYEDETNSSIAITITQKDIREIQLSKGAIRSGINILLKIAGISCKKIDKVILTGAFGNFINKESAQKIGLFPDIPLDKVVSLRNAAGEGAKMALCNKEIIDKDAESYVTITKHIELSTHPDFQDEFIHEMCFTKDN